MSKQNDQKDSKQMYSVPMETSVSEIIVEADNPNHAEEIAEEQFVGKTVKTPIGDGISKVKFSGRLHGIEPSDVGGRSLTRQQTYATAVNIIKNLSQDSTVTITTPSFNETDIIEQTKLWVRYFDNKYGFVRIGKTDSAASTCVYYTFKTFNNSISYSTIAQHADITEETIVNYARMIYMSVETDIREMENFTIDTDTESVDFDYTIDKADFRHALNQNTLTDVQPYELVFDGVPSEKATILNRHLKEQVDAEKTFS